MKITWLGHACWRLEDGGYSVVLDPFAPGSVPGCPDVDTSADAVYCSHGHGDHNYTAGVKIVPSGAAPFAVTEIACYHDEMHGSRRGNNVIRVLDSGAVRAVHLGDLGHMLNEEQIAAIGRCDVLMIPVGGFFTIDAKTARDVAEKLDARVILPMHYSGPGFGYDVIAPVENFLKLYDTALIRRYDGNEITVDASTPHQVAVLSLPRA